jgi:DNA-binding response OmpR family regulator
MGKTILIVADEPLVAMDIEMALSEVGYRVFVAGDISAAQRILDQRLIDVAVLDWHLDHGDNTAALAEQLKQRSIPFVICSVTMISELPEGLRYVPVVEKPFRVSVLLSAVESVQPHTPWPIRPASADREACV